MRSSALNSEVVTTKESEAPSLSQQDLDFLRQEFRVERLLNRSEREAFFGDIDLSERSIENLSILNATIFGNLILPKSGHVRLIDVLVVGEIIGNGAQVEEVSCSQVSHEESVVYWATRHKFIDLQEGFRLVQDLNNEANKKAIDKLYVKVYLEEEIDNWLEYSLQSGYVREELIDEILNISDQSQRHSKARALFEYCELKSELDQIIIQCSVAHLLTVTEAGLAHALTDINQITETHAALKTILQREAQIDLWIETAIKCKLVTDDKAKSIKKLASQDERYEEASKLIKW